MKLNDTFVQTIISTYGDRGAQWLKNLPPIIKMCAQKWGLSDVITIPNLAYNYVAYAQQAGKSVILKLRCDNQELEKEVSALEAFSDYGAAKIIAYDNPLGALLLERIEPGNSLASLLPNDDAQATKNAGHVLSRLHQAPIPDGQKFPTLEYILPKFDKEFSELSPFIERARILRAHLLATQPRTVILHGDFHHDNILLGEHNQWCAIDPEGLIGDPGYDMGLYIRNPLALLMDQPDIEQLITNRIKDFSLFFGYEKQRLYQWTYLQTTSSAYWSLEDGLHTQNHCMFLELLGNIKF